MLPSTPPVYDLVRDERSHTPEKCREEIKIRKESRKNKRTKKAHSTATILKYKIIQQHCESFTVHLKVMSTTASLVKVDSRHCGSVTLLVEIMPRDQIALHQLGDALGDVIRAVPRRSARAG